MLLTAVTETVSTGDADDLNKEPVTTEDEDDAVEALLSLSRATDPSPDVDDKNVLLMPIGGSTVQDAVPVPIRLTNNDVADVMAALQKEVAPAAQDIVSGKNSDAIAANQKEGLLTTRNKMSTKILQQTKIIGCH